MKNQQVIIKLISALLLTPILVSAATDPGIKPGSPFYFLDTAAENISLFFTFNPEKRVKMTLGYADERLAEADAVSQENNPGALKTALFNYENNLAQATKESKEIKDGKVAEKLLILIIDATSKNQEVLNNVLDKVPDEAKEAINKAIENSKRDQEEATKQVAELRGEVEQLKKEIAELKQKEEIKRNESKTQQLDQSAVIIPEQLKPNVAQETPKQHQNYDQELSQMIAETKQRISVFNGTIKETEDFIHIVRNTINKYAGDSSVQSSGQELINENNNFASISKKLVDIETQRVNKISSYLGLGIVPPADDFSFIVRDYNNYYKQYKASNAIIESLMRTFVANEKSALERKLAKERQELDELKKLLSQEIATRQKKLVELKAQIDFHQKRYDTACEGVTMSFCSGQRAYIASHDLNPLIDEYNRLLGNTSGQIYSPVRQTYLKFDADQFGRGGRLYDPINSSIYYTFDCDQFGSCSIYSQ